MIRLYVESSLLNGQEIPLSDAQSHYLQKVMRLREGESVFSFNGYDGEWEAKVSQRDKKTHILTPLHQTRSQAPTEDLWLLFSPLKPKSQLFLEEKATELGVGSLVPVQCKHTTCSVNLQKMKSHLIEAAEQSRRLTLPIIHSPSSFSSLLSSWPQERILLFGDETLASPPLSRISLDPHEKYAFFVGPEGGFSSQELETLRKHPQGMGVTLSSQILRAETAALVGLSYLQLKKMEQES